MFAKSLLRSVVILTLSSLSLAQTKHIPPPTPIHTAQEVLLLFAGETPDQRILLTLNNNRNGPLVASMTLYPIGGEATSLPDVSLVPGESKLMEFSDIAKASGFHHEQLGWLKLSYSGVNMEMGAQLTLYPLTGGVGVDSPRSLAADFKTADRHAALWMPEGGSARLTLTNASSAVLPVLLACGKTIKSTLIGPNQTMIRTSAGSPGPYACDIKSLGPPSSLWVVGTVRGNGLYSAPIRFYDTSTATFGGLTAPEVDTHAQTYVAVHNVSDAVVSVNGVVREAVVAAPYTERLAAQRIAPGETVEVPLDATLQEFSRRNLGHVTVSIDTDAPMGAIVGSLTQISNTDGLVEDIPLRTGNTPAYARGAYPLRWTQDYTNLVSVTNTASDIREVRGFITAGSIVYVLESVKVAPGGTAVFDVDKLQGTL